VTNGVCFKYLEVFSSFGPQKVCEGEVACDLDVWGLFFLDRHSQCLVGLKWLVLLGI